MLITWTLFNTRILTYSNVSSIKRHRINIFTHYLSLLENTSLKLIGDFDNTISQQTQ